MHSHGERRLCWLTGCCPGHHVYKEICNAVIFEIECNDAQFDFLFIFELLTAPGTIHVLGQLDLVHVTGYILCTVLIPNEATFHFQSLGA